MQLITKEIEARFEEVGEQLYTKDPLIICKRFCPRNQRTRYVSERRPRERVGFGYVIGHHNEWGYFALDEIESIEYYEMKIERDIFFTEMFFSNLKLPKCV